MEEFKPLYQIYYYKDGEYTKFNQSYDIDVADNFLVEARNNKLKNAHIQLSFKKGGSVPDNLLNAIAPIHPFDTGGKTKEVKQFNSSKRDFKVRFHLAKGVNFMKWKIEDKANKKDYYYSPEEVNLSLSDCKLTNQPTTANKIFSGQMNKAPIAYVNCSKIDVLDKTDNVKYNPRVAPNWTDSENKNIDNTEYENIVTEGRQLFTIKDGKKFDVGGFIDLSPNSLNNGFANSFETGGKLSDVLNIQLKYAATTEQKLIIQEKIDKLNAPNIPVPEPAELIGNKTQLALFAEVENKPTLTKENIANHIRVLRENEPEPQLTMLSFGGGQDSFCILYKMIHDKAFRKRYAPNDFFVCMSDTGNEHPYTYKAVKEAQKLCDENNIHFMFLTSEMGYHSPAWLNLKMNLIKNSTILAAWGGKSCTANLKINPVDKYMYAYMCKLYNFPATYGKKDWQYYNSTFKTKVRVIIGFAEDEEMRVINSLKYWDSGNLPKWKQKYVQYCFPLIEESITRQGAQDIIKKYHAYLVPPSNCMICFYQSDHEIVWLARNQPAEWSEWIAIEAAKLKKDIVKHGKAQNGVYGKITLEQKLAKAKEKRDPAYLPDIKIGDYTEEQLMTYKMSHGHCVKSNF